MDSLNNLIAKRGINHVEHIIFHQDWWTDIAKGQARVEEARVIDNGVVVAKLPYSLLRLKGLLWGIAPYWTHLNGPIINTSLTGKETQKVVTQLLKQLPRGRSYNFVVSPTLENIDDIRQAFTDAKFKHCPTKTYLQMPAPAPDNLSEMDSKHRRHIKKAGQALGIAEMSPEEYIKFYKSNIEALGEKSHSPFEVAHDLIVAAQKRIPSQAYILAARKKSDGSVPAEQMPLDAAVAIITDDTRAYLWTLTYRRPLPGQIENKPHPDAIKLLILEAAKLASDRGLIFDTDGFKNSGLQHLYRDILKFELEEQRDMFERRTVVARLFQAAKPLAVRTIACMRGAKSSLPLVGALRQRLSAPHLH